MVLNRAPCALAHRVLVRAVIMTRRAWVAVATAVAISGCAGSPQTLEVTPEVAHTGVDGSSTPFRVPITAVGATNIRFSVSDGSLRFAATGDHATISAMRAGTAYVQVTSDAGNRVVRVEVKQYTAAAKAMGEQVASRLACMGCHAAKASDITSSGVAERTDDELIESVVKGTTIDGASIKDHAFTLSAAEQQGVAAYLRSLAPQRDPKPAD
jgi:mono/diheme cytochrome c family protein